MYALSLFSGIGGLDLAAEAAGIETIAFCEREPFCQDVLHTHWPDVPIYDDAFSLRGEDIGPVDVIHGGFPCQPFSVAGLQKGKEDERYLWPEFSRLIGEIRPRWVVAENVYGVLSLAADDVCKDLEARGYSVEIFCYEALAVGALHRRMRVFFVGHSECVGLSGVARRGTGQVSADGREDTPQHNARPAADDESERRNTRRTAISDDAQVSELSGDSASRLAAQSRLGRVAYGFPLGVDLHTEPDIPRVAQGVKDRAARLKALGNAVVPAQAYPIFKAIMEVENNDPRRSDSVDWRTGRYAV